MLSRSIRMFAAHALVAGSVGAAATAGATTPPDLDEPTLGVDLVEGARLAEACASCHAFEPGARKTWGPNLFGIVDRPVGTQPDYRYGPYLREQSATGATWDEAALRAWLVDSKAVAKAANARTKMPAQQLTGNQLDDLIGYLQTLR